MEQDKLETGNVQEGVGWYCVRSQPKHEHIAAARLRLIEGIEVFNPRMRLKKPTRRGVVTFVESVFPSYVFVHFDLRKHLDQVKYSPGVSTVVHFGNKVPQIPGTVIEELRQHFGQDELQEVEVHVKPGDEVVIGAGPFMGMQARVLRVMTPHERVEVLLEMLGRATPVIINPNVLIGDYRPGEQLDFSPE